MHDRTDTRRVERAVVALALLAIIVTVVKIGSDRDPESAPDQARGMVSSPHAADTPSSPQPGATASAPALSPAPEPTISAPAATTAPAENVEGLVLVGTASGSAKNAFAIFREPHSQREQVFHLGKRVFERGELVAIGPASVELQTAGGRSTISIHGNGELAPEGGSAAPTTAASVHLGSAEAAPPAQARNASLAVQKGHARKVFGSAAHGVLKGQARSTSESAVAHSVLKGYARKTSGSAAVVRSILKDVTDVPVQSAVRQVPTGVYAQPRQVPSTQNK